ncbi:cerebellin-3-like [Saccostrea echinata]|uniref:cerebellin-3-like n=1 Tax=Saccostrea echinata TaxID=191078 RepID=UPI002A83B837|nr:cerebellin-3-like [Saccostrea echinata]
MELPMSFHLFLLFFGGFSYECGSEDRSHDMIIQVLLQELQSRVSELEIVIKHQNEIIQDQNNRLTKLEKLTTSENSRGKSLEYSNQIDDKTDTGSSMLTPTLRPNQTTIELNEENVHLPQSGLLKGNQKIKKESPRIRAVQSIAFYAHMSANLRAPGGHQTLIFDTVKTNQGKGYHPHVGVFIVPKSGTYFFTWTMSLGASASLSTELVVNNVASGAIYIHTSPDQRDSATGNLILSVNVGDEVIIRTGDSFSSAQILSDGYSRTDFSGFLIE